MYGQVLFSDEDDVDGAIAAIRAQGLEVTIEYIIEEDDPDMAKIILDYAEASFERSPILKQLIASRTADALELTNGINLITLLWRSARRHSASCVAPPTSPPQDVGSL